MHHDATAGYAHFSPRGQPDFHHILQNCTHLNCTAPGFPGLAQDLLIFLGKLFLNRVERGKFPSSRPIKVSVYILFDEVYIVIDLILMQVALQYVPSYNQDVSIV